MANDNTKKKTFQFQKEFLEIGWLNILHFDRLVILKLRSFISILDLW